MDYWDNIVWEKETRRAKIKIIAVVGWKPEYKERGGIPIDPKIPKWLVKIEDKFTKDSFCPTDAEFELVGNMYDTETLRVIIEAFQIKEKHNKANLKNPECRKKERIFSIMLNSYLQAKASLTRT